MSDRLELTSASAEQTQAFGELLGAALEAGDVLVLTGDLGAGKTQLTKGIARALGITDEVTSPTFALEAVHEGGRIPLYHFDLYRLHDSEELGDAGVWDVLGGDGACVLEQRAYRRHIELVSHDARGDEFVAAVRAVR